MVRVEQLRDLETAKQVASLMEAENARLHQRMEALVAETARLKGEDGPARLQLEFEQLKEQLALMQKRLFGASSEKRGEWPPKPPRAKPQRRHGPTAQPELKELEVVLLPLDEAEQVCGLCGDSLHAWQGQTEDCEDITVVERSFVLRKLRWQKYRCQQGCAPVTAPAPPRLIPGGRYSLEFAVRVALMKYGFHLPPTRQQRLYLREGLVLEAQTLWDQLDALAGHLQKSYEAMLAQVFTSPLIHADETHWLLLDRRPDTKWYAWTVASLDTVFHRILPSLSGAMAKTVMGSYAGVVLVDGYAAYQTSTKSGTDGPAPATLAFCWTNVRRNFFEAQQFALAYEQVMELLGQLHAIEVDLPGWYAPTGKQRQAALAYRLAVRQQQSVPVVERIRQGALAQRAAPGSAFRKALMYMLKPWEGLFIFPSNPVVPIDNNHAERQMRDKVPARHPCGHPSLLRHRDGSPVQEGARALPAARCARRPIQSPDTVTHPKSQDWRPGRPVLRAGLAPNQDGVGQLLRAAAPCGGRVTAITNASCTTSVDGYTEFQGFGCHRSAIVAPRSVDAVRQGVIFRQEQFGAYSASFGSINGSLIAVSAPQCSSLEGRV